MRCGCSLWDNKNRTEIGAKGRKQRFCRDSLLSNRESGRFGYRAIRRDLYDPQSLQLPTFSACDEAKRHDGHFGDDELRSVRQGYYAMVSEVDHLVGRILSRLDELGLAQNTLVVFTSDHGEWLGQHLRYGKGHPGDDCVSRVNPAFAAFAGPFAVRKSGKKRDGR